MLKHNMAIGGKSIILHIKGVNMENLNDTEQAVKDAGLWEAVLTNPRAVNDYLRHLQAKADYKDMVVDGTLDDKKITEAEYKC